MARRLHVIIQGRVQGVGFRYWAHREADARGLTGWVRNRWDGQVEAEFEGPEEALQQMLLACRKGPSFAHVTDVTSEWSSSDTEYRDFRIVG
ncbi:MAG: acylphosphatase [Candidatus Hydrogenedentes bacterium]|nr:acylphosphatase [Candidatus Hydrogenedentota bacterium]